MDALAHGRARYRGANSLSPAARADTVARSSSDTEEASLMSIRAFNTRTKTPALAAGSVVRTRSVLGG